jgi:hypothetical protein
MSERGSSMKHPPVVLIEWMDTATAASSWTDREEVLKDAPQYLEPISVAGFLLADEERGVIVSLLYNHHADEVGHVVIIPRANVLKMTQLRAGKGFKLEADHD